MVDAAMERYCIEHKLPLSSKASFYTEKPSIYSGTSGYLARVCVDNLINFIEKAELDFTTESEAESNCQVS